MSTNLQTVSLLFFKRLIWNHRSVLTHFTACRCALLSYNGTRPNTITYIPHYYIHTT